MSVVSVVISPLPFLILFICILSLFFFLRSLVKDLLILFIFSKNQLLDLLILEILLILWNYTNGFQERDRDQRSLMQWCKWLAEVLASLSFSLSGLSYWGGYGAETSITLSCFEHLCLNILYFYCVFISLPIFVYLKCL